MAAAPGPGRFRPLVEFRSIMATAMKDVMLSSDEVTCVALQGRTLVVGTRLGLVLRADHSGCQSSLVLSGSSPVRAVAVDERERFCASGAANGSLSVKVLEPGGGSGEPVAYEHGAGSVLGVALMPEADAQRAEACGVCAGGEDGRLVSYRRRVLGPSHELIHEGEGRITQVCWRARPQLLAWANDVGVKVFNAKTRQKVTYIPRPQPPPGACSGGWQAGECSLAWAADDQLVIGWGTAVRVAVFLDRGPPQGGQGSGSGQYAEVRHEFSCPEAVCDVCSMGARNLALLTADVATGRLSLRLCNFAGEAFEVAEVRVAHGGTAAIGFGAVASRAGLAASAPHLPMYVAAPRDLLVFQARDLLEHAAQLLEHGRHEEAIALANRGGEGIEGLQQIVCLKCASAELKAGSYERACQVVSRFRGMDPETWRECINLFDHFGGLQYLAVGECIPAPPRGTRLPQAVYDEALQRLVAHPSALLAVLSWWPADIYSAVSLEARLRHSVPDLGAAPVTDLGPEDRKRVEALALLAAAGGDRARAAQLLLDLASPDVFRHLRAGLARDRGLAELVASSVSRLFEIDDSQACGLLVDCRAAVPADRVVAALGGCDNRWRHAYLKQLFDKDVVAGADYHMQMVRLFAEYEPGGLLPFLLRSESYPLEEALEVCQQRGLLQEEVYLLRRAGRVEESVNILLERVGDVGKAVVAASESQDPRLWERFVGSALRRPQHLVSLLDELLKLESSFDKDGDDSARPPLPACASPAHALRGLPPDTPVSRVAASVGRVLNARSLSASLQRSGTRLALEEMNNCKRSFVDKKVHRRGTVISPGSGRCSLCGYPLGQMPPCAALADGGDPAEPGGASAAASSTAPAPWAQPAPSRQRPGGIVLLGRKAVHAQCYHQEHPRGAVDRQQLTNRPGV